MNSIPGAIRIEPAFADPEKIRAMFARHAPYKTAAAHAPEGIYDKTREGATRSVLPWFRGDWALGGESRVEGAHRILHNQKFLEAARTVFGVPCVYPEFVLVNVNGPMPAGATHLDNPSFYGATRVDYPLPFLRVMGSSRLFEPWRLVRATALSWFYDGEGGNFDYWPEGIEGPMRSEQAPFGNFALCVDTDRIYHRIGSIGNGHAESPKISATAEIRPDGGSNWTIVENGEVCAIYPGNAIRFSILWKAEVRVRDSVPGNLTLDRIMEIFIANLRHRGFDFTVPSDPLSDAEWILLLQRVYALPGATPTDGRLDASVPINIDFRTNR